MLLEVAVMLKDLSHIQFRIISSSAKLINVRLKNVFIERSISDKDLLEAYQNADLLAMPLVDVTANNVIMEAMATGLPILTTDVGAVRDYIDRDYGILVPANRPKIFAEALVALAEKPKLCQKMGQKARMIAKEKYDWKKLAPLYEALYIEDMV
jgi:glycosyltransferase involved in cell wall biosynthesis